ncbi:hypothetical protein HRR83_003701 [Exophiala dermatitidis]|uniref:Uncharacterized protein n=2 Tax=Exophiala dermatitidis TaxID=5970 RepID=H6BTA0_EXODN|nr:uncharacterized protein HMPREF1120_01687 [Exophiala dermatitidis NIH/UT8656]KAJ4518993.1 hypothetical protein HRR75_002670 [Exophiala dermatitidis]EHY53496.1 hypothetical protein HMPREF1120_01687 [Exophiala dermatitidis NIH/UT8656]KAJ4522333.1 hypothetical protein HRR74_002917 [Exophiala dermatitidis]KAJ4529658.1 hypothetical protein HRR73_000685 [Exophiala dermatitidis]KAJ4543178.1 hypothetical protein HRR77_005434 [Exophiala dermatitidis]
MVSYSDVLISNNSLSSAGGGGPGPVAVVVGATNGIGLTTVVALLKHTSSPTIYLVGRNETRLQTLISKTFQPLNSSATLIPIVAGDLTLVRNAARAADEIVRDATTRQSISGSASEASPKIDLLILTAGYLALTSKPDWSPEGLERLMAIRFHSRAQIILTLLPLLRRAPSPRVVSVLGAGEEGALVLDDLGMTQPNTYGPLYAMGAAGSMTTLFLEKLGSLPENNKVVFIHTFPGMVPDTALQVQNSFFLYNWIYSLIKKLSGWVMKTHSAEEAGERTLFVATSGRFRRVENGNGNQGGVGVAGTDVQQGSNGVVGFGVYIVGEDSDAIPDGGNDELKKLREKRGADRVWEYTVKELERINKSST